jgi:predicted nucleic acid-binding protein
LTVRFIEDELRLLDELLQSLHQGEAVCLVIAYHRGWVLLTDDLAARQEAVRLNVRKSGSVGCLVLAVERGLCTLEEANRWLARMIAQNYRSPVTDLTPLLEQR